MEKPGLVRLFTEALARRDRGSNTLPMPMISFVIPAHNEEALIGAAIDSIHDAVEGVDGEWEIIVVDDASTDRTSEIATSMGTRVVKVNHRQISRVRNSGAAVANGEYLVFLDADTILLQRTLHAALAALEEGAIGGGAMVVFEKNIPLYAKFLALYTMLFFMATRLAAGCFIFCRREAFEAVGGFSEQVFAGEEVWLSIALKKQGRFVMLSERVISSGRKARQYSGFEILLTMLRLTLGGTRATMTREGLDLWYNCPREPTEAEDVREVLEE